MSELLVFSILSTITLGTALAVIFSKNPVHSILYLVACFFTIAGHYIMLNAQFLAFVQIIVYAGAVMVLFLFVVMMLNLNRDSEKNKPLWMRLAVVVSGFSLLLVLLAAFKDSYIPLHAGELSTNFGEAKSVGKVLFNKYVFPFELTSILFLSAMVGAVILGKKHIDD